MTAEHLGIELHDSVITRLDVAKLLVDAGADPTITGWMQIAALDEAAQRKKLEGLRVHDLLEGRGEEAQLARARRAPSRSADFWHAVNNVLRQHT